MKQVFLQFVIFLSFISFSSKTYCQDSVNVINAEFSKMQANPPMEKLYLHLDKATYSSGATIWFKGYLVTATMHAPFAWSRFIYVELFDKSEKLIARKKIKKQDGIFAGNIKLETELQEGEYTIRAYTTWMLNNDSDLLFKKIIHVVNFQPSDVISQIEYETNEDGKTTAVVGFFDKAGKAIEKTGIICTVKLDEDQLETFKRKTGPDGKITFDFERKNQQLKSQYIKVTFENSPTEYSNKFFLPSINEDDFDLQFFSEGGVFLAGKENNVAFKAIAHDGFSTEISGYILQNGTDTIAKVKSEHRGMGAFNIRPLPGAEYQLIATDSKGVEKSFTLPTAVLEGAALSVKSFNSFLQLQIRARGKDLPKPFYIVAHSCENLIFTQLVDQLQYNIPIENLPDGVIHFVLVDGNMKPVSSRLAFVKKDAPVELTVEPDKPNYQKRELVTLSLNLEKKDSLLRKGDFSISVTDDMVVETDSLADNIYSNLLLTSDLKGNIEDPAFYFLNNNYDTNHYLDLLMLTQGWQRFDIGDVINNKLEKPKHFLEVGQTISGVYESTLLGKQKDTPITALAVNPLISVETKADENGNFLFEELDFPDSTVFTIQSQKYTKIKQEPAGFIKIDKDSFPSFSNDGLLPAKVSQLSDSLLHNAEERLYYEGEGRMILLDEFVVKATDKRKNDMVKYGMSSTVLDQEALAEKFPIEQMADFIVKTMSGVFSKNDQVFLQGSATPAEIYVDGMETDMSSLSNISSKDIDKIVVIKGAGAALYSQGGGGLGGVILINLKEGGDFTYKLNGVVKYAPLGYQKPSEFYVPKYEVDSIRNSREPDVRSTVYWQPNVIVDESGAASIQFYAADPNTNYTYILEGITDRGDICRYVGKLRREPE
ncbi:TonB-dependent receptor plug domain-containing protein [Sunxiuqinia sp. A32]|uniref:TonB-dependent receptor plug domain-containing protein n=1 Tax=Sunxiuqinia sp. A32 TaxID=3461496 RepID=UPI0040458FF8